MVVEVNAQSTTDDLACAKHNLERYVTANHLTIQVMVIAFTMQCCTSWSSMVLLLKIP